jgi:Ca2+-binding RTX toxin-like protein
MAVFSVLNGTGIGGAGVQFGTLSSIASSGISGSPNIDPTTGSISFTGGGKLALTGVGMSFTPPSTFTGVADSMTYSKPSNTPVFSITGMSVLLQTLAGLVTGGDENTILAAIFAGADQISGSSMNDVLKGFDGNDTLKGGAGADNLDGGLGLDFVNYQGSTLGVSVDLKNSLYSGGDAQGDVLTNIENIYGSSHGDTLSGSDARNIIGGESGDDLIKGNAGDDSLSGEGGNDGIDGGDGVDRLVGGAGTDILHGDAGNDSIDAGADNDQVFGDAGNDVLFGNAGDDLLDGGDDNDVLEGGAGADQLIGGNGTDTASYASSPTAVNVVLGGVSSGGDAAGDTYSSIEQVIGSAQNDTITGDAGVNTLWGMGGDDVLIGSGGADVLKGGAGNDKFTYVAIGDSTVAVAGRDTVMDFTAGDKIDLSAIDANGDGPGDAAFTFGTGAFTGAGQVRVLAFAGGRYGVYLETNGNNVEDALITVYSDHALTAADFVL